MYRAQFTGLCGNIFVLAIQAEGDKCKSNTSVCHTSCQAQIIVAEHAHVAPPRRPVTDRAVQLGRRMYRAFEVAWRVGSEAILP